METIIKIEDINQDFNVDWFDVDNIKIDAVDDLFKKHWKESQRKYPLFQGFRIKGKSYMILGRLRHNDSVYYGFREVEVIEEKKWDGKFPITTAVAIFDHKKPIYTCHENKLIDAEHKGIMTFFAIDK